MNSSRQPGLFDFDDRLAKLAALGDPLVGLKAEIDFEAFRGDLDRVRDKVRKSNAGAKPFDVVLMFKVLILQHLYLEHQHDKLEFQIRDRLSFMRFLDLEMHDRVPDAKTVWAFRERLNERGLTEVLFERFKEQLAQRGFVATPKQMIDATFVEVPRQRNSREENALIKAGEIPKSWDDPEQANRRRQKDTDARWTKKNVEKHYGYKNHINADAASKLIQDYQVTPANVHDSQVFEDLLDTKTTDAQGKKRAVYADSAYRSQEHEAHLVAQQIDSQIHEKGSRSTPLTDEQQASNRRKSSVRAREGHIFGGQATMGGHYVRTIGLARAKVKIGLMNLAYNMRRLVQLTMLVVQRQARLAMSQQGVGSVRGILKGGKILR